MRIRAYRDTDWSEWLRMSVALFPEYTAEDLAAGMREFRGRADGEVFIADRDDDSAAGFVEVGMRPYADGCDTSPVAYVEAWYVDPDARRAGYGRALLGAAEAWARECGYREMASDALLDNAVSHAAHQGSGYEEVGRVVQFRKLLGALALAGALGGGLATLPAATLSAQSPIGAFDGQTDVGRARPGSATYDPGSQSYAVAGSGQNMWAARDDFHYVWKRLSGNFILSARARLIGRGVEAHRKIGWTIRPALDSNSSHVTAALHGDGLASLQFRRAAGGTTEEIRSPDSLPAAADAEIQLERRDGVYLMSVGRFGDSLVTHELTGMTLPDTVYVGLFVCAHNDTVTEHAQFSNVRITIPAKSGFAEYRDYIGSNLEILDLATGNATIVHQYSGSFQAPNWTRDGKALIYAQEGRLYRFDLASKTAAPINTGFATHNNNDHVLSFDGRTIGISNHAAEDSGASIVYTVPTTGGDPKRVTARGPSYLHGWCPDGRWLVYTGQRDKEFDVFRISVIGGNEIRLTSTPGLDDGPEYTPDGRYIYFNSVRSGRMQIWRMRPDGSSQEQITNDGLNNWFPHISPDGKWIAFISFPPDVAPDDHPFYKRVTIRLMPIGGGPSRVIAYVYGGQGTINVPSWSPDGKRLAFVSNSVIH
ncbi:MAG TPA: GNAT family N-acetyltransferase [Gemmatimonadaceae bacterium]|nr:GNAT family N-acetyltransferase [Gemmatimonadaceae bacterium]